MSATDQITVTEPPPVADAPAAGGRIRVRRLAWLAGTVAAGWLVSGIATLLHVDWVLLPLLVVAVASVLRMGRNVLDRLMMSTFAVAGGLVAAGLLFSLWPWGLAPFPVAGSAFTAVAVAAYAGNRRPRIPRGFTISDLIVAGIGLFVFVAGIRPLLHLSYLTRFPFNATAEDRAAHFALFDTIHRLGSYPFLDQVAARVSLQTPTEGDYPAATHYLYALIDIFTRSTTDPGPAIAEFNRYFILVVLGFAFFLMATVWAARWIVTPFARGWRQIAATATVSAILIGGTLWNLVVAGFDSQVLGLAFVGLTVAFAVRPPTSIGERVLMFGAGTVLVAYAYYFYLPLVAIAILTSVWFHRRTFLPAWRPVAVSAVVVGAIAILPLYFAATSKLDLASQLLAGGAMYKPSRSASLALTVACLAPLLTPFGRRCRETRIIGVIVASSFAMTMALAAYQVFSLGMTTYYFEKLLAAHVIVTLVCCPVVVIFFNPMTAKSGSRRREWLRQTGLGAAAAVLAFTSIAGFGFGLRTFGPRTGEWASTPLGKWFGGNRDQGGYTGATTDELNDLASRGLLADGKTTLFLVSNSEYINWRITFTNGTLNRTNGATMAVVNRVLNMSIGGAPRTSAPSPSGEITDWETLDEERLARGVAELKAALALRNGPVRIVVGDDDTRDAVRRAVAGMPGPAVTVLDAPLAKR
jgi:hypothetical protein